MNISKAKSVMIAVFLALNLFLLYHLLEPGWGTIEDVIILEERQRMVNMLTENNYVLEADIPLRPKKSFFLTVTAPQKDADGLKELFFGDESVDIVEAEEGVTYSSGKATLFVQNNGFFSYIKDQSHSGEDDEEIEIDEQEALNISRSFLQEKGLLTEDTGKYEIKQDNENIFEVIIYEEYEDIPLFSGHIKLIIKGEKVTEVRSYRPRIVGVEDRQEMKVISATVAIMRLIEELGYAEPEKVISNIAPGFYSREYEAEEWEVSPVWRISLDKESFYYINAFTGNIENKEMITGRKE